MSHTKPTILLIPGSFHPPELWHEVQRPLEAAGYRTSTVGLLSNNHFPTTHDDIPDREAAAIRDHVQGLLDNGDDILIVMHSYAGVPGSNALKGLSKQERQAAGAKNGVIGLVYLCAFMLWENARLLEDAILAKEPFLGQLRFTQTEDGWQHCSNAVDCFYQDVPKEKAEGIAKQLVRRDSNIARAVLTYPAYKQIKSTYVFAEKDQAIILKLQEYMVDKVKASGASIDTVKWDTGHSPFFVDPARVANFLMDEALKRAAP